MILFSIRVYLGRSEIQRFTEIGDHIGLNETSCCDLVVKRMSNKKLTVSIVVKSLLVTNLLIR